MKYQVYLILFFQDKIFVSISKKDITQFLNPLQKAPSFLSCNFLPFIPKGSRRKSDSPACCNAQHVRQDLGPGQSRFSKIILLGVGSMSKNRLLSRFLSKQHPEQSPGNFPENSFGNAAVGDFL